jgi:two-component system, OmpR family, sensor histidine kinase KdpD
MNLKHNHSILDIVKSGPVQPVSEVDKSMQKDHTVELDLKNSEEAIRQIWKPSKEMFSNWRGYIWGLLLVAAATFLGQFFAQVFSLENIIMFYLLIVVVAAIYWGLGPSIISSILIILALDYFFISPFLGFIPFNLRDLITLAALFLVSILISYLASRFRQKSAEARRRELEISSLYSISRELAKFTDLDPSIRTIMDMGKGILGNKTAIFLPDPHEKSTLIPFNTGSDFSINAREYSVAHWSFQHRLIAGQGTENFPNARGRYQPLVTPRGAVGVMTLWDPLSDSQLLPAERIRLFQAFSDLVAVCIENIQLAEEAKKAEVLKATEKLQTAILNSLSHDLRTPLVSVIGVLSSLQEEGLELDEVSRKNLIQVALEDAERLNGLIANLLDISRIEAGAVKLVKQTSDIADLIGVALERLENRIAKRQIEIDVPAELPLVDVDFNLMVQALYNILDNAFKYSKNDSSIEISARQRAQEIEIEIADHGIGVPPADLPHIFDKFYRVQRQHQVSGTGLGLSICKGIVESHRGHIQAENRLGGGTIIKISLPSADNGQEEMNHDSK